MELVILADIQNSFGSNWCRVANTAGLSEIKIGERFREQGVGEGGEELEVAGVDISPVGGFSKLFFNRGAHATHPEVHRLGAVFHEVREVVVTDATNFTALPSYSVTDAIGDWPEPAITTTAVAVAAPAMTALSNAERQRRYRASHRKGNREGV